MSLTGKTVLIIGAGGFVGTRLSERLNLTLGARVIGLVRNLGRASRLGRLNIDIVRGDALDERLMVDLIGTSDFVVNLLAGDNRSIVGGTRLSARLAREWDVRRYVHMSSAAVYGLKPLPEHIEETARLRKTSNEYSNAKIRAEDSLNREVRRGLRAVTLRPRVVWGPYSTWVLRFFEQLVDGKFTLVDEGQGACNTIFIDNLIEAVIWALESESALGETFFVTDGERVTWREFYEVWASFLDAAVEFSSVSSESVLPPQRPSLSARTRAMLSSDSTRRFIIEQPGIRTIWSRLKKLPEAQKIEIRARLRLGWPEKRLVAISSAAPQMDYNRCLRESGTGFTKIDKLLSHGFQPRIGLKDGSQITAEWLAAARYI